MAGWRHVVRGRDLGRGSGLLGDGLRRDARLDIGSQRGGHGGPFGRWQLLDLARGQLGLVGRGDRVDGRGLEGEAMVLRFGGLAAEVGFLGQSILLRLRGLAGELGFLRQPVLVRLPGEPGLLGLLAGAQLLRLLRDEPLLLEPKLLGEPALFGLGLGTLGVRQGLGAKHRQPGLDHRAQLVLGGLDQLRRCGPDLGTRRGRRLEPQPLLGRAQQHQAGQRRLEDGLGLGVGLPVVMGVTSLDPVAMAQLRQNPAVASQQDGQVKRRHSRQKWNAPWNGSRDTTSALESMSASSARIPTSRPTRTR